MRDDGKQLEKLKKINIKELKQLQEKETLKINSIRYSF